MRDTEENSVGTSLYDVVTYSLLGTSAPGPRDNGMDSVALVLAGNRHPPHPCRLISQTLAQPLFTFVVSLYLVCMIRQNSLTRTNPFRRSTLRYPLQATSDPIHRPWNNLPYLEVRFVRISCLGRSISA